MDTQTLITELTAAMQKTFDVITADNNHAVICESDIDKFFDEDLHEFMKDKFGLDYSENDAAQYFYQMNACDVRMDFERMLLDWMEENAESNERIELNAKK